MHRPGCAVQGWSTFMTGDPLGSEHQGTVAQPAEMLNDMAATHGYKWGTGCRMTMKDVGHVGRVYPCITLITPEMP